MPFKFHLCPCAVKVSCIMGKNGPKKKVYNVQKHLNGDDVITKRQSASHNSICSSYIASHKEILAKTSHVHLPCVKKK